MVCSLVPGSRSSALPRTITKASSSQSSAYLSAMSATSGFSRMFLTRLSRVTGTSFGFSSRAMKIEARVRAKQTGTACGLPIPSEVADGPPSGARGRRPDPHPVRRGSPSNLDRAADARGDLGGEQAQVGERLFVGDTGETPPETGWS